MILVLGVWTFLRALLGSSAAVTLEKRRPTSSTGGPAAISRSTPAPAAGPHFMLGGQIVPQSDAVLVITAGEGTQGKVNVTLRIDTPIEVELRCARRHPAVRVEAASRYRGSTTAEGDKA